MMDELAKSMHKMQLIDQQAESVLPQLLPVDEDVPLSQYQNINQQCELQANSMQHAVCSSVNQSNMKQENALPNLQIQPCMQTTDQPPALVSVPSSPASSSSSSSSDDEHEIMPPVVSLSPHRTGPEVPLPPSRPQATDNAVGLLYDQSMELHKGPVYPEHYEQPQRIMQVYASLEEEGLLHRCWQLPPRPATTQELLLVHTQEHVDEVEAMWQDPFSNNTTVDGSAPSNQQQPTQTTSTTTPQTNTPSSPAASYIRKGADLYICADTAAAARMATGCCIKAVQHVLDGDVSAALAIVRPPGHHAECARAQGFCFFNNCAVAARVALNHPDVRRVLILDWDVHHGNGIQEALWEDPNILYISIHRDPKNFYPFFAGFIDEVGEGAGKGFNINIPWVKRNMGDAEYTAAFKLVVEPVVRSFSPDLIIVAAGFDAAEGDPIGGCKLTPEIWSQHHVSEYFALLGRGSSPSWLVTWNNNNNNIPALYTHQGYASMTRWLLHMMMPNTSKLVMALEGGYNTRVTAACAAACVRVLLEEPITRHNSTISGHQEASSEAVPKASHVQQHSTVNMTLNQSQQHVVPPPGPASTSWSREQTSNLQGCSVKQDSSSDHTGLSGRSNNSVTSRQAAVDQGHQAHLLVEGLHTISGQAVCMSQQTHRQEGTPAHMQTPSQCHKDTSEPSSKPPVSDTSTASVNQSSPAVSRADIQHGTHSSDATNCSMPTGVVHQPVIENDCQKCSPLHVNDHRAGDLPPVSHAASSPANSSNSVCTLTGTTGVRKSGLSAHIAGRRAAVKQACSDASSQTQQQTANDSYVATSNLMPTWPTGDAIKVLRQVCEVQAPYWPILTEPPFNVRWAHLEQCLSRQAKAAHGESRKEGRRQSSRLHKD